MVSSDLGEKVLQHRLPRQKKMSNVYQGANGSVTANRGGRTNTGGRGEQGETNGKSSKNEKDFLTDGGATSLKCGKEKQGRHCGQKRQKGL